MVFDIFVPPPKKKASNNDWNGRIDQNHGCIICTKFLNTFDKVPAIPGFDHMKRNIIYSYIWTDFCVGLVIFNSSKIALVGYGYIEILVG